MGSKSPSNTTSTVKSELPDWAKPYSVDLMKQGAAVASRPYEAYTGNQIAGFSPEQQLGLNATVNRSTSGNAAANAGNTMLQNTLQGNYLNPSTNPYLRQNVDTAMSQAQGKINGQFNTPGAFGSTAHQGVMANSLGGIASNMYGQNYATERNNMMQAAPQALGYAANDWTDINALLGAGDTTRQLSQDQQTQAYNNWLEQRNYPLQQLDILGNSINQAVGNQGSTLSTAPNPNRSNGAATALGAGLAGYGLLS
jgi:hypothetical protein